jgi:hypothetical protein
MFTHSLILLSLLTLAPRAQESPATAKRTRPDKQQQLSSVQKSAISALEPLLEDIRQVDDLWERVALAETLVSLLFTRRPEASRKLLNSLLDDCIRLKTAAADEDKTKRADPDSLVRKIIQIAANFDQKLAKSLLERYNNTSDQEPTSSTADLARAKFRLTVATELIEKNSTLAASTAEPVLAGPVIPETLLFLNKLRERNPPTGNRLLSVALRGVQSRGGRDPNELLLLFSYIFSPQRIPVVTNQGMGVYHLPGYAASANHQPDLALAKHYLETTVQLLLDPGRYSRENLLPTFGPVGDWFLIKLIEPNAALYRGDLVNSLLAQGYVLEGRLQSQQNEASASLDRWNNLPDQNQNSATNGDTVDYLLKRADQPANSKRRDQLLYRAAMVAVRNHEYDRALEIVDRLSSENQKKAKQFLTFDIALAALRKHDVDRAARLAEKDDDLLRRAYVFTLIAKSLIERKDKDIGQARIFLSGVETLLPKLDTDKDRVSTLVGTALVYSRFDKPEASKSLRDLIRYANKVEGFAGETSVSRMLDVGGFYFEYSLYAEFSLSELLSNSGQIDFNATLEDVRQLESRTARFKAIVAVSKGVLSGK